MKDTSPALKHYSPNWIGFRINGFVVEGTGIEKRTYRVRGAPRVTVNIVLRSVKEPMPFIFGKLKPLTRGARDFLAIARAK